MVSAASYPASRQTYILYILHTPNLATHTLLTVQKPASNAHPSTRLYAVCISGVPPENEFGSNFETA
jgi:hypothetical protein